MKRPALRTSDIEPFVVMDVLARAQALEAAGRRVIHMEIGEPDFTAPEPVVEAAVRALRERRTGYTATLGIGALREAIAAHYARTFGAAPDPARIAVTTGASGALLFVLALYVDAGDEILVPDPGYPGYRHMVRGAWSERTAGLVLGSPSNPTGTVIDAAELARIAAFVAERGGVLIVDEIYQGLVYGQAPATALGLPGEVVVINSFSKYFCMTGWRLGWAVLPAARVRDFEKLAQHLSICAPSMAQHAALAAFLPETLQVLEERRAEFARRRDFLVPALERAGLRVAARPSGAFYVYADCGADGRRYALELLESEAVAATPGVDFGANGTGSCVRFAYTRALADLEEAAARLRRFGGAG